MLHHRLVIAMRLLSTATALALLPFNPVGPNWQNGALAAEENAEAEKQAFDAAKELGTVEAWDAFLSNYPKGFRADLARAYVKKLAEPDAAAPATAAPVQAAAVDDYPTPAGSWGGVVRSGPGQQYKQLDSLDEGDDITLMGKSDVFENGYPWFKIAYRDGQIGYKWGGILCATGPERPDLFKTCPVKDAAKPKKSDDDDDKASKPKKSGGYAQRKSCLDSGGRWRNTYCDYSKRNKSASANCKELGLVLKNGKCVSTSPQVIQKIQKQKKIGCPPGTYLNPLGVCQGNETGG